MAELQCRSTINKLHRIVSRDKHFIAMEPLNKMLCQPIKFKHNSYLLMYEKYYFSISVIFSPQMTDWSDKKLNRCVLEGITGIAAS